VNITVAYDGNASFDWSVIFTALFCLFLAGCLFLFIRNNDLLARGGQNLWRAESLMMLAVIAIPFVLTLIHFFRHLRHHNKKRKQFQSNIGKTQHG
jgi:hypothetical protein